MPKNETFDREVVLRNATKVFWKKGFHGTSMQDVVDATQLNRSSIYNSFGDKLGLFMESLRHYQAVQQGKINNTLLSTKSPKEAIKLLLHGIVRNNPAGCFLVNCTTELSPADKDIYAFLSENQKTMTELLIDLVQKAQEVGEIDKEEDANSLALYLFSSLQGLRVTSMIVHDENKLKNLVDDILRKV